MADQETPVPDNNESKGLFSNLDPIQVTAGVLSVGLFSIAIGTFNHYNASKDFRQSVTKKTQEFYQKAIEAEAKKQGKTVDQLTEQEKQAITDNDDLRKQLFKQKDGVSKDQESYLKAAKNGWTMSGAITGFGLGGFIAGLLLTPLIGPLAILAGIAIGGVLAAAVGAVARKIAEKYTEKAASDYIVEASHNPKNLLGKDPIAAEKERKKDEKFIEQVSQKAEKLAHNKENSPKQTVAQSIIAEHKQKPKNYTEKALGKGVEDTVHEMKR